MKRQLFPLTISALALLLLAAPASAAPEQDDDGFIEIDDSAEKPADDEEEDDGGGPLFEPPPYALFVTAGPALSLNLDDSANSAPSPVAYSIGFGADFRQDRPLVLGVRGSLSVGYWLWDGSSARPAEVENRTATVPALMLDFTAGHTFAFSRGLNSLTVGGGLGLLARVGFLSSGVSEGDEGASGSASSDVSEINSWFWSSARFVMPELCVSFLRASPALLGSFRFGGEFRAYLPLGSVVSGEGVDGMTFALSVKASF